MVSNAEEAMEESSSAVAASGSQLQQAGQSEASEDDPCPICLGEANNAACVALCFHRFCFGCIQRWAVTRAVCPLCRRPFDRILRVLPADEEEEEDGVVSSASCQKNIARERSRSRAPQRYVLASSAVNNSNQASRGNRAPGHPDTTSQWAPGPSASWAQIPPSTGERMVSLGDGPSVHIGTLALPPLHVQLSFRKAQ